MADITPIIPKGKKIIEAYGNKGFKVTGERFSENIIVLPDQVYKFEALDVPTANENSIQPIVNNANEIEVLLVGCGKSTEFFSPEIEKLIKHKKISIEYMDTGAAARTYNVLLSEERKVAVILIAV